MRLKNSNPGRSSVHSPRMPPVMRKDRAFSAGTGGNPKMNSAVFSHMLYCWLCAFAAEMVGICLPCQRNDITGIDRTKFLPVTERLVTESLHNVRA